MSKIFKILEKFWYIKRILTLSRNQCLFQGPVQHSGYLHPYSQAHSVIVAGWVACFHLTESMVKSIGLQCKDNILNYYSPSQIAKRILTSDNLVVTEKWTQSVRRDPWILNSSSHLMWLVVQLLLLYLIKCF